MLKRVQQLKKTLFFKKNKQCIYLQFIERFDRQFLLNNIHKLKKSSCINSKLKIEENLQHSEQILHIEDNTKYNHISSRAVYISVQFKI